MDLTSVALLSMFGAAFAGGLIGLLVGNLTRFEAGMAVGLSIFGAVTLAFAWQCFAEYRAFAHAGANGGWGEVVRIVDKPSNESGSITSPAPIVKFIAPDATVYFIEGPTASGARVGEHVNVIFDARHPEQSRIGQISELRGGAIALMLFGTFPLSFALIMIAQIVEDVRQRQGSVRGTRDERSRVSAERGRNDTGTRAATTQRGRLGDASFKALFVALFCSIVWIGIEGAPLIERFSQGFSGVAVSLAGMGLWGATVSRLGAVWTVGLFALALNFGVWAFALHLLR